MTTTLLPASAFASKSPPYTRRRGAWLAAAIALVATLYWGASREFPAGPAAGFGIERTPPPPSASATLRLATFNIHGAKGPDGRRDPARVARALEGYDFAALFEVHRPWPWSASQVADIGGQLQSGWLFAPTERRWWGEHFGSGIVSRVPVHEWRRIPWPRRTGVGYRNALVVDVPCGGRTVHVLATHIDSTGDRESQLRSAIAMFLSLDAPAVLMGDLNSHPDDPQLAALRGIQGVVDCLAAAGANAPARQLDWIFVREMECRGAGIVETGGSDHPLVWAEVSPLGLSAN